MGILLRDAVVLLPFIVMGIGLSYALAQAGHSDRHHQYEKPGSVRPEPPPPAPP